MLCNCLFDAAAGSNPTSSDPRCDGERHRFDPNAATSRESGHDGTEKRDPCQPTSNGVTVPDRRIAPGDTPMNRLKARLNAASD